MDQGRKLHFTNHKYNLEFNKNIHTNKIIKTVLTLKKMLNNSIRYKWFLLRFIKNIYIRV